MNFASTMVLVSLLVPSKGWYAPSQPLEVTMHASGEFAFKLTDFSGRELDPEISPNVKSDKPVDVRKMFGQLATPGTYLLYGVKKGAETTKDFVGTPLVINVRPDQRRGAPPGPMVIKVEPLCYATMSTDAGDLTMAFYYDVAPNNIANFLSLSQSGFYDGLTFNRIIKDFIIQSGDPRGDGTGGPGYMVDAEFGDRPQFAGVISMARSADPNEAPGVMPRAEFANTAGSQFFICLNYTNTQQLDRRYTAIGKVMSGMETVNKIGAIPSNGKEGKPTTQPVIKKITVKGVTVKENPYPALIESATTMPTDAQPQQDIFMAKSDDSYKEKFRPETSALDKEIDAALEGVSMDALYGFDKPAESAKPASGGVKGTRKGKIISVGKDDAFVEFGGKSQGIVSLIQFTEELPKVGDEMEFNVERYDEREGVLILTRKGALATNVSWENMEVGTVVEGTVTGVNKGGLEIDIKGMRAFMPAGQVDLYFNPDLSTLINQRIKAEVTQFDARAKNLVLSRRNILEREKEEAKAKLMEELAEGQIRRGTVRNVMDFGAFVDLGGADGLLHVSEMSFRRGQRPSELVKVGDVLDVKIIKFDKETGKMSLSLKQALGVDPWADVATKYAVGSAITGRVTKVEDFGAFIEVEEGVEGLLPVSEISWQRVKHPSDVVKEGDTLRLVVLSVDPVARRMSFSLKQAGPDPWKMAADSYPAQSVVNGTVSRVVDFGAFVELEPGLEGLVHISELTDQRVRSANDVVKIGQSVSVLVLEVDANARRISLSLKRAAGGSASSGAAASATPQAAAPKKKKTQLRGGLDF